MSISDLMVALGAFRGCDAHARHHGIRYVAVMEWTGADAVEAALRGGVRARTLHPATRDCGPDHYAVLDGLDEEGDNIATWCIPDRAAWEWWVRAVELRAVSSGCPVEEPAAYAAIYGAR